MVSELEGMFAIAVYDAERHETCLVRDRCGKKPLYYARTKDGLIFASELRALRAHPFCSTEISRPNMARFMMFGAVPAPHSLVDGVRKVEAGTVVTVKDGIENVRKYWVIMLPATRADAKPQKMLDALDAAVARRVPTEVPVGVFMSGGLDSSIIAALASRHAKCPLRTFSIGFEDATTFDETTYAELAARYLKTDHTALRVSRRRLADETIHVLGSIDEPIADQSLVATVMLSRLARTHVKAVLTGDGADEILMGYNIFIAAWLIDSAARVFPRAWLRAALLCFGQGGPSEGNLPFAHVVSRLARTVTVSPERRFYVGAAPFEQRRWQALFHPAAFNGIKDINVFAELDAMMSGQPLLNPSERLQMGMLCHFLRDVILAKLDRATMSQSLEARCPFLDLNVATLGLALPAKRKLCGFTTKRVLRQCAGALLPPSIVDGRKRGFRSPIAALLRHELQSYMTDVLSSARVKSAQLWDPHVVESLVAEHVQGRRDNHRQLWSLTCVGAWLLGQSA